MIRHRSAPALLSLALLLVLAASAPAQSTFPSDSVIQALIDGRVAQGTVAGIAIGLIEPDGRTRFLASGNAGPGRSLSRESVFEIGSITKVFTGILLADMVRRGEVSLEDPAAKYLPAEVTMPARNGAEITLGHLSTQTSGLPRMPSNFRPADPLNPYVDYTAEQLYEFLSGYTLPRDPGAQYEYSNVGVGLLGHVLALRAGMPYDELVRERILEPLGMDNTGSTLTPWMQERAVAGHSASGDTVPWWGQQVLAGAGSLRSSIDDMLTFAEAALRGAGPLRASIDLSMAPRAAAGQNMMVGLGWHRMTTATDTIVWHNGGTGGFRTFVGIVPATGRGIVLMANSGGAGADDIALHLLDPALPLAPPARQAVDVPADVLSRYVGTYELAPQFSIEVTLVDGTLRAQATGQPVIRLWAASETEFFIREVDAQVTFRIAPDGTVSGLVLHQNGQDMPGRKIR
ncbi:MAG TPA: serine hydrolase [Longimicrobiales bacterium]|nr:serine hydrolase [Longimicrobiales bacterium]